MKDEAVSVSPETGLEAEEGGVVALQLDVDGLAGMGDGVGGRLSPRQFSGLVTSWVPVMEISAKVLMRLL